jgi:Leucine-rich repeat (LRR) protein
MESIQLSSEILSAEFHHPEKIETLELEHRKIHKIDTHALKDFPNLHTIYLGFNFLTSFDSRIFQGINLKRLLLNSNGTNMLNYNFSEYLTNLISLDLSDNKLLYPCMEIFENFCHLKSLNLARNKLFSIDFNLFYGLKSLTSLSLMNNKLKMIDPRTISHLTELQELDLSMNELNSLDFTMFENLRKLKILKLNDNKLTLLDHGLSCLSSLEELEVRNSNNVFCLKI